MAGSQQDLFEYPKSQANGIDGLNLVEFPLSVLSRRILPELKTLEFEETIKRGGEVISQQVILTGSDKFGLPTSTHHDLLLAAIQLSREKNGWESPRFEFSIYELLEAVGWHRNGHHYDLAAHALCVYKGMNCFYKDAWFVNGKFRTKGFSIIDDFELYRSGRGGKGRRTAKETREEPSYIVWGSVVFSDFKEKRTKGLDHSFYRELSSAKSKQLYRYLDKWFHYGPKFHHPNAVVFGEEKIGLSRNYKPSRVVKELNDAADELATAGYLKPASKNQRFTLRPDGVYQLCFERASVRRQKKEKSEKCLPSGLEAELVERGVNNAAELLSGFAEQKIRDAIENFDDRNKHGEEKGPGWLRKAIEEGYGFRNGYKSKAELEAKAKKDAEKKHAQLKKQADEQRRAREDKERAEKKRAELEQVWKRIGLARQIELEDEAMAETGNKFVCDGVRRDRTDGKPGMYHEMLWEQTILPKHFSDE